MAPKAAPCARASVSQVYLTSLGGRGGGGEGRGGGQWETLSAGALWGKGKRGGEGGKRSQGEGRGDRGQGVKGAAPEWL